MLRNIALFLVTGLTACGTNDPHDGGVDGGTQYVTSCDPGGGTTGGSDGGCDAAPPVTSATTRTETYSPYLMIGDGIHAAPSRSATLAGVSGSPLFGSLPVSTEITYSTSTKITGWRVNVIDSAFGALTAQLYKTDGYGASTAIGPSVTSTGSGIRQVLGVTGLAEQLVDLSYEIRVVSADNKAGTQTGYFADFTP